MIDDAIFEGSYFFLALPDYDPGAITLIEAQTTYYVLTLALPERISVS